MREQGFIRARRSGEGQMSRNWSRIRISEQQEKKRDGEKKVVWHITFLIEM